jgi:hypothetical protein
LFKSSDAKNWQGFGFTGELTRNSDRGAGSLGGQDDRKGLWIMGKVAAALIAGWMTLGLAAIAWMMFVRV